MQGTTTTAPLTYESLDPNALMQSLLEARKKPNAPVPAPPALQPVVGAAGPPQSATWTSSQTHPRTTLNNAIQEGEAEPLTFIMDLWEQITTRTAGTKLKAYMEKQIDTLGERWCHVALAQAAATYQKRRVGLVSRFKTICEDEIPARIAAAEDRYLKALEAEQERRQAQWEADEPKRIAAAAAKRQVRAEMDATCGKKPFKKSAALF